MRCCAITSAGPRRSIAPSALAGPNAATILFKREDLNHTGAHKINNTIGQALLARRMGKTRFIAETGAGQHGVATATVGAKFGVPVEVFMGAVDVERQALNVYVMKLLGATRAFGRERHAHAQGRDQRSVPRLGGPRRRHVLHHRQRRRRASVSVHGARIPEGHRHRSARASARALRQAADATSSPASAAAATRWASSRASSTIRR